MKMRRELGFLFFPYEYIYVVKEDGAEERRSSPRRLFPGEETAIDRLFDKYLPNWKTVEVPDMLSRYLLRSRVPSPTLPQAHAMERLEKKKTEELRFFDTVIKDITLDAVVFDNRYQVTLSERHEYEMGRYYTSGIKITSYMDVVDLETGREGKFEVSIPDDSRNRFYGHLGTKVEWIHVRGDKIRVRTTFGVKSKWTYCGLKG